ncbi:ThuA domain-containing protein [Acrocarpospora catenulata]|uniref:ThuA domain-containing protein n=1 Tax=Acrocarpospora catenulata TaxID=2836182 RepID=UPI002023994D|nr:ThuA domain-containing protein [Acrocarpospora catenulata]
MARNALVVRGGWEGHQPVAATDLFIPFLRDQGFDVRVADSPEPYADAGYMAGVDLVVQCVSMSTITGEQCAGLSAAVRAGTGLAGWHGGICDSYRNNTDYLHLVGGQFACHPGKPIEEWVDGAEENVFVPYRVEIVAKDHPITAGVPDFDLVTEQYWVLSDEYNEVLATTTHPARDAWRRPVTVPAIWTRSWGNGRVFVATPGHDLRTLRDANVRTVIERGMVWASR